MHLPIAPQEAPLTPAATTRTPHASRDSSYIPGLDGIRALAFLMVGCAHLSPVRVAYFVPATLGVTVFFFLSGFLICTLLRREWERTGDISLRDFYIRRTLRIFLPLYTVYALALVYSRFVVHGVMGNRAGLLSAIFYYYNYGRIFGHAAVVQGLDVIWSLSVEEHFYILFPVVLLWMMRRRMPRAQQALWLAGVCVVVLGWRCVLEHTAADPYSRIYYLTDTRLDSILWGCILALAHNPVFGDRDILPSRQKTLAFLGAVAGLVATLVPHNWPFRNTARYTLQALCLYLIFSFVIRNIRHPLVRWLEWKPLRYLGWVSYVMYLAHEPIAFGIRKLLPSPWWAFELTALAATLAFATVMRYAMEIPLQRLRARFRRVPEADRTAADGHGLAS